MLTLPCAYLPPIEWFAALQHGDDVRVEVYDTFQKQTYRNRCHIASPSGVQVLTIPVQHQETNKNTPSPLRGRTGEGVAISEQGAWRHLHLQALRSSYQMTPYYDYYRDELEAFYLPDLYPTLYGFNLALARWMAQQMGIERPIAVTTEYCPGCMADIHPKHPSHYTTHPYYQVFAQRTGFLPGLSAIDLLMNMGPESILYL